MKNVSILALLFVMTLTISFKALATGENDNAHNSLSVINTQSGKYDLIYESDKIEKVQVSIFNEKGLHIHTEHIKRGKGFKLPFDLSNLPEGSYLVKVNADGTELNTTINHEKEPASFFKAFIKPEDGKLKFSVKVVRHEMRPVLITIIDKNNREIFSENIDVDYNFERKYDLKDQALHAKTITVLSDGNMTTYNIK